MYSCMYSCGAVLTSKLDLIRHVRRWHCTDSPPRCRDYNASFSRADNLARHPDRRPHPRVELFRSRVSEASQRHHAEQVGDQPVAKTQPVADDDVVSTSPHHPLGAHNLIYIYIYIYIWSLHNFLLLRL